MLETIDNESSVIYFFFQRLKKLGFNLGIDEYNLFFQILRKGYLIQTKKELLSLLKHLWLKSELRSEEFDYHFYSCFQQLNNSLILKILPTEAFSNLNVERKNTKQNRINSNHIEQLNKKNNDDSEQIQVDDNDKSKVSNNIRFSYVEPKESDIKPPLNTPANFTFNDDYIPINKEILLNSWRNSHSTSKVITHHKIDIKETIKNIGQTGFFTEAVYQKLTVDNCLIILVDVGGSMIAFHPLCIRIIETAQQSNFRGKLKIFYFRNVPYYNKIYTQPSLIKSTSLNPIANYDHVSDNALLIISDAGAARGSKEIKRIQGTLNFLNKTNLIIKHLSWINPMPAKRWRRNTAHEISKIVDMFPATNLGIKKAIRNLSNK